MLVKKGLRENQDHPVFQESLVLMDPLGLKALGVQWDKKERLGFKEHPVDRVHEDHLEKQGQKVGWEGRGLQVIKAIRDQLV